MGEVAKQNMKIIVVPTICVYGVILLWGKDNLDADRTNTQGKGHFHGTVMSTMQFPREGKMKLYKLLH